jgi:hypothetical protein
VWTIKMVVDLHLAELSSAWVPFAAARSVAAAFVAFPWLTRLRGVG